MTGRLISVNLGVRVVTGYADGPGGQTGIDKRPTDARVRVSPAGELDREIGPGRFGENLSTEGLDLTGAVIGERWSVGTAVLEVTSPRIPCMTFTGFWDVPDLIKRFTAHGASGAYLRVIRDGDVGAGDPVEVVSRPAHGVTIGETFRALTGESALLPRLLDAEQ